MRARTCGAIVLGTTLAIVGCGPAAPSSSPGPSAVAAQSSSTGRESNRPAVEFADVPFMRGNANRTAQVPGPGPVSAPVVAWDVPLDDEATLNPIIMDGLVLTGGPSKVVAIDARTGTVAWQRAVPGRLDGTLGAANGMAVAASTNTVVGLDVATGDIRWTIPMDTSAQRPEIIDGVAYLGTTDGLIAGLDLATGHTVWSWQGPRGVTMRADLVANGIVYASSTDGRLFTIAIADKTEGWTFQAPTIRINPSLEGDTIYASSAVGETANSTAQVVALDAATGKVRWRFLPPGGGQAIHGAVHDGILIVTTRGDGAFGLRATDGSVAWHNGDVPVTDWVSILAGDIVYLATRDSGEYALDAGTGTTLWHTGEEGNARGPIVSGGLLIVTRGPPGRVIGYGEPGRVAELPIASAGPSAPVSEALPNPLTIVRSFDVATTHVHVGDRRDGPEGTQATFGPDGKLYVIDADAMISVLDPQTGMPVVRAWGGHGHGDGTFDGAHDIAVARDGRVYVADAGNHRIQVFDPSGAFLRQIGSFGTRAGQFSAPTTVTFGSDGSLYVMDATAISRFDPSGDVAWRVGGDTDPDLRFRTAYDLAVLPDGRVLVALDPGRAMLVLDPNTGAVVGTWGPDDIGASPEPVVAPDGRVWMFQYVSERIDVFEADGTRLGTLAMNGRDAAFPELYPTPVIGPNGHAYSFSATLGLVELAVDLPPG
jgi:outer membrane protein assembly factor BamB